LVTQLTTWYHDLTIRLTHGQGSAHEYSLNKDQLKACGE
jgi:hypothetical protein